MGIRTEEEDKADVSMSPLIDCVFLLLIFFLVSTMAKKKNRDINISLPESKSAEKLLPSDEVLVIGIDRDKLVYYEGEPVTLNMLHLNLRTIGMETPDKRIRLDADEKTSLSKVIEVLDLCRFNNLTNIGIRTYDEHYNKR